MTTTTTTPTVSPLKQLGALARAEYLQFRRNRTLMVMGTLFPIGLPLMTYLIGRRQDVSGAELGVTTIEMFAYMALLFVQYYSVLSLITTRRGEGVLKRLRTGEAADWQIKTAPAAPGVLLTLVGGVVVSAFVWGSGVPAPVNPVLLVLALVGGLVVFSMLALLTAAYTKNAEAAQVTSLPVIVLATMGLAAIRGIVPERMADYLDWTPFAAVSDLVSLGMSGEAATGGGAVLDFAGTFGEMGQPVVTLVAWTVIALVLTQRSFRWDERG